MEGDILLCKKQYQPATSTCSHSTRCDSFSNLMFSLYILHNCNRRIVEEVLTATIASVNAEAKQRMLKVVDQIKQVSVCENRLCVPTASTSCFCIVVLSVVRELVSE